MQKKKNTKVNTIADELKNILDFWDKDSTNKDDNNDLLETLSDDLDKIAQEQNQNLSDSRKKKLRGKINLREEYLRRQTEKTEAEEINLDFDNVQMSDYQSAEPEVDQELDFETTRTFQIGILDPTNDESLKTKLPTHDECIFCRIKNSEVKANVVYQDDFFTVILTPNGLSKGHLTIFPNGHFSQYMDIPASFHKVLHRLLPKLVLSLQSTDLKFSGVDFYFSDPIKKEEKARHYSINLIPRNQDDGLRISVNSKKENATDKSQMKTFLRKLKSNLSI